MKLPGGMDLNAMMQQAQQMQEQMGKEMKQMTVDASAGGGAVTVKMRGDFEVLELTISPDLVYLTDDYPTHKACGERRLTHYENLNNLKDVVNQRFLFVGLPLRLEPAYGSPIRAIAIIDD